MKRIGKVYIRDRYCGTISQDESCFVFRYDKAYLSLPEAEPVSLTMPLQEEAYESNILFPFFDGLIPEGYLLEIALEHYKIKSNDRMELLLKTCKETLGCVSVMEAQGDE